MWVELHRFEMRFEPWVGRFKHGSPGAEGEGL